MKNKNLLGPWIRRFLLEHLVAERNLSPNTQASYRDTLTLLLPFVSNQGGGVIDRMTVEDLTPAIVRKFLDHLLKMRIGTLLHCSFLKLRELRNFPGGTGVLTGVDRTN